MSIYTPVGSEQDTSKKNRILLIDERILVRGTLTLTEAEEKLVAEGTLIKNDASDIIDQLEHEMEEPEHIIEDHTNIMEEANRLTHKTEVITKETIIKEEPNEDEQSTIDEESTIDKEPTIVKEVEESIVEEKANEELNSKTDWRPIEIEVDREIIKIESDSDSDVEVISEGTLNFCNENAVNKINVNRVNSIPPFTKTKMTSNQNIYCILGPSTTGSSDKAMGQNQINISNQQNYSNQLNLSSQSNSVNQSNFVYKVNGGTSLQHGQVIPASSVPRISYPLAVLPGVPTLQYQNVLSASTIQPSSQRENIGLLKSTGSSSDITNTTPNSNKSIGNSNEALPNLSKEKSNSNNAKSISTTTVKSKKSTLNSTKLLSTNSMFKVALEKKCIQLTPTFNMLLNHYECLYCEKKYVYIKDIMGHIKKGECRTNMCDMCLDIFPKNSILLEHYTTKHSHRAICVFCFTSMRKEYLKQHLQKHCQGINDVCNKYFETGEKTTSFRLGTVICSQSEIFSCGSIQTAEGTSQSTRSQPTISQPTTSQPATSKPTTTQPTTFQPATSQPTTSKPTTTQPTTFQPTTSQSIISQLTTSKSTTSQPTTSQSSTSNPTISQQETPQYIPIKGNDTIKFNHYKCFNCDRKYIIKQELLDHLNSPQCFICSCDQCEEIFPRNFKFYLHYKTKHTDRSICHFCYETMGKCLLKSHMEKHYKGVFTCKFSNERFDDIRKLTTQKVWYSLTVCQYCCEVFPSIKFDKRSHLSECNVKFSKSSEINPCKLCGVLVDNEARRSHVATHFKKGTQIC